MGDPVPSFFDKTTRWFEEWKTKYIEASEGKTNTFARGSKGKRKAVHVLGDSNLPFYARP